MRIRKAVGTDNVQLQWLLGEFEDLASATLSESQQQIRAYTDRGKMIRGMVEEFLSNSGYFTFVAEENGKLIGYITGMIKMKEGRVYNKEGYIKHFFVQPEYQSQKVGKRLFEILSAEFEQAGCTHLGVDTHLENTKAIRIYEHLGFTKRLVTFFKKL